jgi:transposase-like protein
MEPQICGDRPNLRRRWEPINPFFAFAPAVRKIIYTTDEIDKRILGRRAPHCGS